MSIDRRAVLSAAIALPLLAAARAGAGTLPLIRITKDPSCGCCEGWAEHVRAAGFPVRIVESDDMTAIKQRLGVPDELASCHTAEVDGYVIEGHVPAPAIRRLLAERPDATGLAVPGMPMGSPGMETPGADPEPYEAFLFGPDTRSFGRFLGARQI